jgi:hypothetical protein
LLDLTSRSRTAANTLTRILPSAACSGVGSIVVFGHGRERGKHGAAVKYGLMDKRTSSPGARLSCVSFGKERWQDAFCLVSSFACLFCC